MTFFKNVPINSGQNVPLELLVHRQRRRVSSKEIEALAVEKFGKTKSGIVFEDVITKFVINKKRAQRKLKDCCANGILFAPGNHKPQRYYALCQRSDVMFYITKRENVLLNPTGVTSSKHPLSNALELQKAQNFLDILARLPFVPPYIHKLQFLLSIDKEAYVILEHPSQPRNRAKRYEEYVGKTHVIYTYSPNGTVEIAVECSNNPFKLETDDDVCLLFSFLGQVRDRMLYHLSDPRECIVPPVTYWCLKQCDVNKDIEINDKMQFTLPDIQLKHGGRVLRAYVKSLAERAVNRCEESLKVDLNLTEALDYVHNPNHVLEKKVDRLIELVQRLSKLHAV